VSRAEVDRRAGCCACLLTNFVEAFQDLIQGVTRFTFCPSLRSATGDDNPRAGCGVDGDDWEKGAQALRAYASTWPAAGMSSASNMWCS